MKTITCLDCLLDRPPMGRGLCSTCYSRRARRGTLDDRPKLVRVWVPTGSMTAAQIIDRTGITYRQLDYWCRTGYLKPDGGVGCGSVRAFSATESRVAFLMARLTDAGLAPAAAHKVARGREELAPGVRVLVDAGEVSPP